MSHIAIKKVEQSDDPGADKTYETDSETMVAASDILALVDELDNGEALIIWKEIY